LHYMSIDTAKAFVEILKKEDLSNAEYLKHELIKGVYIPVKLHMVSYSFLFLYIRLNQDGIIESEFLYVTNKDIKITDDKVSNTMKIQVERIPTNIPAEDILTKYKTKTQNTSKEFSFINCVRYIINQDNKANIASIMKNETLTHLHPTLAQALKEDVNPYYAKRKERASKRVSIGISLNKMIERSFNEKNVIIGQN